MFRKPKIYFARPKIRNIGENKRFSKKIWNNLSGWKMFCSGQVIRRSFEATQKHKKKPEIIFRDFTKNQFKKIKIDKEYNLGELQKFMHLKLNTTKLDPNKKYICVQKGVVKIFKDEKYLEIPEIHFITKK